MSVIKDVESYQPGLALWLSITYSKLIRDSSELTKFTKVGNLIFSLQTFLCGITSNPI